MLIILEEKVKKDNVPIRFIWNVKYRNTNYRFFWSIQSDGIIWLDKDQNLNNNLQHIDDIKNEIKKKYKIK